MKTLRAADLRRSLGRVARELAQTGDPVALTIRGRTVGVLVSPRDWKERFTDRVASQERARLVEEILAERLSGSVDVDEALQELRAR